MTASRSLFSFDDDHGDDDVIRPGAYATDFYPIVWKIFRFGDRSAFTSMNAEAHRKTGLNRRNGNTDVMVWVKVAVYVCIGTQTSFRLDGTFQIADDSKVDDVDEDGDGRAMSMWQWQHTKQPKIARTRQIDYCALAAAPARPPAHTQNPRFKTATFMYIFQCAQLLLSSAIRM